MSRRTKVSAPAPRTDEPLAFSTKTAIFGGAGLAAVAAGYFLLWKGDITLAPLLLVLGYLVLIPAALAK